MKTSAVANANIALVKYWGKRNERLILPQNSSVAMTTAEMSAHTTVEFSQHHRKDVFILNGNEHAKGTPEWENVSSFLDFAREMAGTMLNAKVVSNNNFPTAAGLASSAAGFAALATAANEALGLQLDRKNLSMLARHGSGSAARSIYGGFVKWKKGEKENGSDSFAMQIADENHWPEFRMLACITTTEKKKVKSRTGMAQSVATSPYYARWRETAEEDAKAMSAAILRKDFAAVGSIAEQNCLKMHATALTTRPPIIYWNAGTLATMEAVLHLRDDGMNCYFTIDGGPQVKVLCEEKEAGKLEWHLQSIPEVKKVIPVKPGKGALTTDKHLF